MPQPHLIVLMASQLRRDVLGPYGPRKDHTPAINALAEDATVFDNHYTTSPLGRPARASVYTGLYPWQHGAIIGGWSPGERAYGAIRRKIRLYPDRLLDNGYRVVHVGSQQVRTNPDLSVLLPGVEFLGPGAPAEYHQQLAAKGDFIGETSAFLDPVLDFENGSPVVHFSTSARTGVYPLREHRFYDSLLTELVVGALRDHDPEIPIAVLVNFWLPHPPLWAPEPWASMFKPEDVTLPPTCGKWLNGQPALQLANLCGQIGAHVDADQWRKAWAMYLGMVGMLDGCVGRIVDALRDAEMFDDSLIMLTSDHGEMLGSHALFGKGCFYEEVAHVPLIMRIPWQDEARRITGLTTHLDLPATLLDAADVDPLRHSDGRSLMGPARGQGPETTREYVFGSYDGNAGRSFRQRMIRSATHKLIHNVRDRTELYDLRADPMETRNLAGDPKVESIETELRDALNEWMDQMGDRGLRCPLPGENPRATDPRRSAEHSGSRSAERAAMRSPSPPKPSSGDAREASSASDESGGEGEDEPGPEQATADSGDARAAS